MGRPRTPDTRLRKPCCSVKPVRHISMFDCFGTLPSLALTSSLLALIFGVLGLLFPSDPFVSSVLFSRGTVHSLQSTFGRFGLLFFFISPVGAVCPHCFGNFPSCTFDTDQKCPTIDVPTANAAVVAAGVGLWFLLVFGPLRDVSLPIPSRPRGAFTSCLGQPSGHRAWVYTPALPDVCVVARSSSVLMQAILLFVFTSYCPCDALQRGGREQAKIGGSRRTWRGARGLAVSILMVSSVEPRVVGVLGTSECWSTPRGTSAHS